MSGFTLEKRSIYLRIQHNTQHDNREDLNYQAQWTISSFPLSQGWATGKKILALSFSALVLSLTPLVLLEFAFFPVVILSLYSIRLSFSSLPPTPCLFNQGHVYMESHNP